MTPDEHSRLEGLAYEYAAIIGIIRPTAIGATEAEMIKERAMWPHLMKRDDGLAVFDYDQAALWMAELSECSEVECLAVLKEVWPIDEDDEVV